MATLVLSAAGMAVGGAIGGSVMGLSTAVIGRAAGAALGRVIDQRLMGAGSEAVEVGRIDRFRLTGASEGTPIPRIYGRARVAGQIIWASRFREHVKRSGGDGGGKGGSPSTPETKEYSYSVSFAVALSEGVIGRVGRIWADGTEISPADLDMRVYKGTDDQLPDPKIEAVEGAGNAPAYRGIAYVVIEDFDITRFGNRLPQLSFEVMRPVPEDLPPQDMAQIVEAVAMMPGSGEYSLSTKQMRRQIVYGKTEVVNVNTPSNRSDFKTSVDALVEELPNCGSVSLVVSWFGNDLRCGDCDIEPKVEWPTGADWTVSGASRSSAALVPQQDGTAVYGGTPSDRSVIEAIGDLQNHDQKVVFYPFILMEQLADNGLPDPYSDASDQPVLPWRGRITSSKVLGQPGSPDGTAAAEAEVAAFFGRAQPHHFDRSGDTVRYSGPQEWSYRRFILHYANLCRLAGGVDAFCIGSEMRGLTWIRGENNSFPAVAQLKRLAQEVRDILGPDTRIGYAADWSEYFGYQPQDGTGDRFFHLDPLWADDAIDFIGIDNYMPLSDWRDGDDHADAAWGSIYNLDYLTANVAGGEGYDWYYASPEAEAAQIRTPITDEAHGEPWIWRYKDIKNWWSNAHHERIGGVRQADPTDWMPGSKPIWFTEIGCAAIDKGTNQPNKFLDPKSSESSRPNYSNGLRDDFMQLQYLRALHRHWSQSENNPVSTETGLSMVDTTRAHVWAWDARPFPFFPNNREVWSDGANYARGHWITGRATARPLASVVAEVCEEAGIADYDVSALWGIVRGYVTSDVTTGRAALQSLMTAYGFDAIEKGGKLVFRTRTGKATAIVDPDHMVESSDGTSPVEFTRHAEAEVSGRVRVGFVEADVDYAPATAEAVFPGDDATSVAQSDLSLTLTRAEGQQIAERWLAEARVARDTAIFALPPSRSDVGAGDVVALPEGRLYRIDRVETTEDRMMEATRVEPESYRPHEVPDHLAPQPSFIPPVPVAATFLDLPLMRGDEVPHAPHVAFTGVPWPGTVALYSAAQDSGYALSDTFVTASIIGTTESPLFRAAPGRWDRGAALRVRLVRGTLQSVAPEQILAGANLAAIGDGTPGNWELFQFANADLVGEDTYELSLRLRGQAGTDGIAPADWPPGSRFVLIDGIPRQIDLPSAARGTERHFRFGPASRPLDDDAYDYTTATFDGIGLRPYRPCHLRLSPQDGDIRATWIRRTRIDGDSWAGLDVPLGEERESYLVRVNSKGTVIREAVVSSPEWTYRSAERSADGPLSDAEIAVAQLSERFGPGPFATVAL